VEPGFQVEALDVAINLPIPVEHMIAGAHVWASEATA
jgi:hypothetical protein